MSSNLTHYYRHPGLTKSGEENILRKLQQKVDPEISGVDSELCYNLDLMCDFTKEEEEIMNFMLSESYNQQGFGKATFLKKENSTDIMVEVGPRVNIVTAWCTNALSIFRSSNIRNVRRIEMSKRYLISTKKAISRKAVENVLHDEMTETIYRTPLTSFATNNFAEEVQIIPVMEEGSIAIERINRAWSLALSPNEVNLITSIFRDTLKRNPTDVEFMDFIQSNNEHSRHFLLNGKITIDGKEKERTMADILRSCKPTTDFPSTIISFGQDGSAIRGTLSEALISKQPGTPSAVVPTFQNKNPVATVTTHNFPSGVTPFPGAETGVGGQIREVVSTGNGASVMGGAAGFLVGNLNIPGHEQPWESHVPYPKLYSSPLTILLDASAGAADYANKYGEPIIAGTTRSFGQTLPDGSRSEYIKPVVMSNGIGCCYDTIHNDDVLEEDIVIAKIGGPAFRMGLKGGALSSKQQETQRHKGHHATTSSVVSSHHSRCNSFMQDDNEEQEQEQEQEGRRERSPDLPAEENIDFEGVQRGDAEMGNKLCRVVTTCLNMGQKNPIINIFNQGAGGNSNVMKLITACRASFKRGVRVNLDQIVLGDDSLSAREIWGAEYQENVCVLVKKENIPLLRDICARERIHFMEIGQVTDTGRIEVFYNDEKVVDLPVDATYDNIPQHEFDDQTRTIMTKPLQLPDLPIRDHLLRTLSLLSVGSKRFFVEKFDRSITGLIASQPCCGPLYLPVADVAVIAKDYRARTSGVAFAIGEQPIKSFLSLRSMVRLSIGEALTNIVFGNLTRYSDIHLVLSFNCAGKLAGETARMYECCEEVKEAVKTLGLEVVNVKDSVSMAVRMDDETIKAPMTLAVTAFANCEDVNYIVTPDIKHSAQASRLLFIDLNGDNQLPLGGSALAQVYSQLGDQAPEVDLELLQRGVHVTHSLIKQGHVLAGHDRSDGGLLTTVLEMAFAGNCGLDLQLPEEVDAVNYLFNEGLGFVLEVDELLCMPLMRTLQDNHIPAFILGSSCTDRHVTIRQGEKILLDEELIVLREAWEKTSYELEKLSYNQSYVVKDYEARMKMSAPQWELSYTPLATKSALLCSPNKYRVCILREEGTNCDREMVAAFYKAGLEPWTVTVSDLMERRIDVSAFHGLVFCGGFSFGDVLDSARGWASCILFNDTICKQFNWFIQQDDRFSLGVCNGCQLMSQINYVPFPIEDRSKQPRFIHNEAGKLECRFVNVRIEKSNSVLLRGMEGSTLGVWIAHGEGRCHWPDASVKAKAEESGCIAMRYVDNEGQLAVDYPANPNGSAGGIAALCSLNGHHLSMMPHPIVTTCIMGRERLLNRWAWPYWPEEWDFTESPWLKMFQNARIWCEEIHSEK